MIESISGIRSLRDTFNGKGEEQSRRAQENPKKYFHFSKKVEEEEFAKENQK